MVSLNVGLPTLDITDIPFKHAGDGKDALQEALGVCLASERDSMCELAVPMHEICTRALLQESLPNLQVVEFKYCEDHTPDMTAVGLFRASEGHIHDDRGESGLTELRLIHVVDPPCTETKESGCGERFFERFRTPDIENSTVVKGDQSDKIASFVALFPSIDCLRWNGSVTPKIMETIVTACSQLKEMHLSPQQRYGDSDMADLLGLLAIAHGKVKTLRIKGAMFEELARLFDETYPELEVFSDEICSNNVATLKPLLATRCRKVHTLDLSYLNSDGEEPHSLRPEGWCRFHEALQSASSELKNVVVRTETDSYSFEWDFNALVEGIVMVLETLNGRAKIVRFQVPGYI